MKHSDATAARPGMGQREGAHGEAAEGSRALRSGRRVCAHVRTQCVRARARVCVCVERLVAVLAGERTSSGVPSDSWKKYAPWSNFPSKNESEPRAESAS
jgi:hypothetical protein